ncbi:MAG: arginine deiminase-related protein [Pseudomonadota bacterium]
MVRPREFASNPQTAASNAIQRFDEAPPADQAQREALMQFEVLVATLREAGVTVVVVDDDPTVWTPDAVFPNNWFSTHADGRLVLYPMLAPNRRAERRADVYEKILPQAGFAVERVIDLSDHEADEVFLESTGSLVLDRVHRVAYGCRSARTHDRAAEHFSRTLGYQLVLFDARDPQGAEIYHTNVMMAIGEQFVVICSDAIVEDGRDKVLARLEATGRDIIDISPLQLAAFAGNVLELAVAGRKNVIAMSQSAHDAFTAAQMARLTRLARPLAVGIGTIELCSGGSVRCMLAEIHLPRSTSR